MWGEQIGCKVAPGNSHMMGWVHTWRSKGNFQKLVLFFYVWISVMEFLVVSLGSKHCHLMNHFTSPEFFQAIFLSQENFKGSLNWCLPSTSYRGFLSWEQMGIDGLKTYLGLWNLGLKSELCAVEITMVQKSRVVHSCTHSFTKYLPHAWHDAVQQTDLSTGLS